VSQTGGKVRGVTNPPASRITPMCLVDCPLCDRAVGAVVDDEPSFVLAAAA
jgi:hypothetical protein